MNILTSCVCMTECAVDDDSDGMLLTADAAATLQIATTSNHKVATDLILRESLVEMFYKPVVEI